MRFKGFEAKTGILLTMLLTGSLMGGAGQVLASESRANTATSNAQEKPVVAMASNGYFVVVWQSFGQDGDNYGIYGQRYDAYGNTLGAEFRVNTTTADTQDSPAVAMDAAGNFVVAWQSYNQDEAPGGMYGIYFQRYNSAGVAQGSETLANTETNDNQHFPAVAMDADGDFVVVWSSDGQDMSNDGVYFQRYNSSGVAQGAETQVNTYTALNQWYPSVGMDNSGNFVVAWTSYQQDGFASNGVYAQRFNSIGVAQGGEFQVNTTTTGDQEFSSTAMDSDGDFVITWSGYGEDGGGDPLDSDGIYGQRYNSSGVAQGGEFLINTNIAGLQQYPSVAMTQSGNFVVTWDNTTSALVQRYTSGGVKVGSEFRANVYTVSFQRNSSVAAYADARYIITWESNEQDTSGYGVYTCEGISADTPGYSDDVFTAAEDVYGRAVALNLTPSTTYNIYLTADTVWVNGMAIPARLAGSVTTFNTDSNGNMSAGTLLWSPPYSEASFDIVIDSDGDGIYDANTDFLDNYNLAETAGPTLVDLISFTATGDSKGVLLKWKTASETQNAGFNIWRSDTEGGEYLKLNIRRIPAKGDEGHEYKYRDKKGKSVNLGAGYYYKLEDVDVNSNSTFHGPVMAEWPCLNLVSPEDDAEVAKRPTFEWVKGLCRPRNVEFSDDALFSSNSKLITYQVGYGTHTWRPGVKAWRKITVLGQGGKTVYWRLRGKDREGFPVFTLPYKFTIAQ